MKEVHKGKQQGVTDGSWEAGDFYLFIFLNGGEMPKWHITEWPP